MSKDCYLARAGGVTVPLWRSTFELPDNPRDTLPVIACDAAAVFIHEGLGQSVDTMTVSGPWDSLTDRVQFALSATFSLGEAYDLDGEPGLPAPRGAVEPVELSGLAQMLEQLGEPVHA